MNKTLVALMNKLSWQINEIIQQLDTINQQLMGVEKKLASMQEKIHKACVTTTLIHPEQEIARLNYLIQNQQHEENLRTEKKALEAQQLQLQTRQARLNSELKMLDKYQEKQQEISTQQDILKQQNASDEWTLQRKKPL